MSLHYNCPPPRQGDGWIFGLQTTGGSWTPTDLDDVPVVKIYTAGNFGTLTSPVQAVVTKISGETGLYHCSASLASFPPGTRLIAHATGTHSSGATPWAAIIETVVG